MFSKANYEGVTIQLGSIQVLHQQIPPNFGPPPLCQQDQHRSGPQTLSQFADVILEQKVCCLMTYTTGFRLSKYAFLLS